MANLLSLESDATLTGSEVIYLVDGTDDKKATIDQVKDFVIAAIPPGEGGGQQTYTIEDWDIRKTEIQEIVPIDSEFLASTLNPDGSETISLAPIDVTQQYLAQPTLSSGNNVVYLDGKIKVNGEWGTPTGGLPFNWHHLGFSDIESIRVETDGSEGTEANWACDFQMFLTQLTPEELVQTFANQQELTTPYIFLNVRRNPNDGTVTKEIASNALPNMPSIYPYSSEIVLKPSMDGFHFLGESIPVKAHPNYDPTKTWNAVFFLTNPDTTTYQYDIPVYKGFNDISITRLIPALPDGDLTIQFPSTGQDKEYYVSLLPELVPPEADVNELIFNKINTGNFALFSEFAPNTFGADVYPSGRPGEVPPLFSWSSSTTTGDHEIIYEKSTGSFYFGIIGDPSSRVEIYNESYLGPILSIAITPLNMNVEGVRPVTLKMNGLERLVVINGDLPIGAKDGQMYKTLNEGRWQDKLIAANSHISFYENLTKFIVIPNDDILQGLSLDYIQTKQRLIADVEVLKTNQIGNYRGTFVDRWSISNISYKKGDYVLIGSSESSLVVYHAIRDSGLEQYGPYYDFQILTGLGPNTITTDNIPEGSVNKYYDRNVAVQDLLPYLSILQPLELASFFFTPGSNIFNSKSMFDNHQSLDNTIIANADKTLPAGSSGVIKDQFNINSVGWDTPTRGKKAIYVLDWFSENIPTDYFSLDIAILFRDSVSEAASLTKNCIRVRKAGFDNTLEIYDNAGLVWSTSISFMRANGHFRLYVDVYSKKVVLIGPDGVSTGLTITAGGQWLIDMATTETVETHFGYVAPYDSFKLIPKRFTVMEKIELP